MVRKISGAKRRKRAVSGVKRKTRRRRGRVSGTKDLMGMVEKAGGLTLGAVGARQLNALAVKLVPGLSPTISGLGQMAAGYFLPKFMKGSFVAAIGDGMIANGGMVLLVTLLPGVLSGVGGGRRSYQVNGTTNLKVIQGTGNLKVIGNAVNGFDTRISNQPSNLPKITFKNYA